MSRVPVGRRQMLRFLGAGALLGSFGTAAAETEGEYIVGTRSRQAVRAAQSEAASVRRVLDFGSVGQAVAGRFSEQALRGLSRRGDVRYIEPDGRMYAIGGPSDIDSDDSEVPWGIDRVDAEKVHGSTDGTGARVAVIDTGIDSNHRDLPNVVGGVAFVSARGPYAEPWDDDNGHGTHCAGTVGAVDDGSGVVGVAPGVDLYAVKVLDSNGSGSWSDVAAGIKWTADNGMHVGSMSLGGGKSKTVKDACTYAYGGGVLLVAAAGNDGGDVEDSAPATYDTVVAVSATKKDDTLPDWSNTGADIELAAPGVGIKSTTPGGNYSTYSGTSMACPHVSGGGGYLMAAGYTNTDARTALHATAEDLGSTGRDEKYGYGILDVEAIVTAVGGGSGGDGDTDPAVTTGSADVTSTTATLNGNLDDLGGADSAAVYFEWGPSGDGLPNTTAAETLYDTVSFSASLDGLVDGESYEFRAVADASDGDTATGSEMTFTTTGEASSDPPTVSASASEAGSPNPHAEITVDWSVSDSNDDLMEVVVDVTATDGSPSDSRRYTYDGSAGDSGSDYFEFKHQGGQSYDVTVTATDSENPSVVWSDTVSS